MRHLLVRPLNNYQRNYIKGVRLATVYSNWLSVVFDLSCADWLTTKILLRHYFVIYVEITIHTTIRMVGYVRRPVEYLEGRRR